MKFTMEERSKTNEGCTCQKLQSTSSVLDQKEVPEKSPGNNGIPGGNASYLFKRAIGRFLYNRTVAFDPTCLRLNHCLTSLKSHDINKAYEWVPSAVADAEVAGSMGR